VPFWIKPVTVNALGSRNALGAFRGGKPLEAIGPHFGQVNRNAPSSATELGMIKEVIIRDDLRERVPDSVPADDPSGSGSAYRPWVLCADHQHPLSSLGQFL